MGALDGRENGHVNVNVNVNEPPQPVDRWTAGADGPLEMMPQVALVSSPLTEGYSASSLAVISSHQQPLTEGYSAIEPHSHSHRGLFG
jgi:hypothetical protein